MPTLSCHVPDSWSFHEDFETVVKTRYDGKPGRAVKKAIEHFLSANAVTSVGEQDGVLTHLADQVLSPLDAIELKASMEQGRVDQRRELQRLLLEYLSTLQSPPELDVAEDFDAYGSSTLTPRDEALAQRIAALIGAPSLEVISEVAAELLREEEARETDQPKPSTTS